MHSAIPHAGNYGETALCGAHTKSGGLCKGLSMPNGRCRMHGGASRKGFAHPRYQHGRYSKYSLVGLQHRAAIQQRKRYRAKLKAVRAMKDVQLIAEARRIFGKQLAESISAAEMREMLVALYQATLRTAARPEGVYESPQN